MTKLIKNCQQIWTGRNNGQEVLKNGWIYIENNVIKDFGDGIIPENYNSANKVIDGKNRVFMPGMVNTHHHLYQTFTRGLKSVQDAKLFDWLTGLYCVWGDFDGEGIYLSAKVGIAELILSGCTTTTDHLYLFPNGAKLEDEIKAAEELGIRFHPARGSMCLGKSDGGLPPDHVTQNEDDILQDCKRVIEKYHNPNKYSMLRIVLGPCSPFSVTGEVMKSSAELARKYNKVFLHTHIAETFDEEEFCIQKFGNRPVAYMDSLGWLGNDVWYAHSIFVNDQEIELMAKTGTGMSHCPSSNMRLGSGIAPIRKMLDKNLKVSLAVDGSSSNDGSHMLAEARQALLLQRVKEGADGLKVKEVLKIATSGGANVIGRADDIGLIERDYCADIIAFKTNTLPYCAASYHDPVGSLILCQPQNVDLSIINGKIIVENGEFKNFNLESTVKESFKYVKKLIP